MIRISLIIQKIPKCPETATHSINGGRGHQPINDSHQLRGK